MVRITKVYTRTGDRGTTRLAGGQKVPKDSARIEAFGTVDELMSALGAVPAGDDRIEPMLRRVQNELFNLGATLATLPRDLRRDTPVIRARHVRQLEREIDAMNAGLSPLKSFILPGGGPVSAGLHVARTVCRRAEREVVRLGRAEKLPPEAVRYLNRLSDWLFVAARWAAKRRGEPEPLWEPDRT